MAIYYKLVPRKKPGTTTVKWYGSAVNTGVVKIDQLAEEMSSESTVTRHDVLSVLSSLQQHIMRHLADRARGRPLAFPLPDERRHAADAGTHREPFRRGHGHHAG